MLKAVSNVKNNDNLLGIGLKISKVFDRPQVERFLLEASDEKFLMLKIILIMGLADACCREEDNNNNNNLFILSITIQ